MAETASTEDCEDPGSGHPLGRGAWPFPRQALGSLVRVQSLGWGGDLWGWHP